MKTIFNCVGWLLFAIERLAVRGQEWLDDHYPVSVEEALADITAPDIASLLTEIAEDLA